MPASPSPPDVSLPAALAMTGPADRSPPGPAGRIDRAAGLARDRSREVDFDVASAFPRFWSQASLAAPETGVFDDNDWPFRPAASASNCLSSANAANATCGSRAIRIGRHLARSNIHAGCSSQRSLDPPSREQCRTVRPTSQPLHGQERCIQPRDARDKEPRAPAQFRYCGRYPAESYNYRRPHQGRWCFGKTPMQTFLDAIPLAKEKLMAA